MAGRISESTLREIRDKADIVEVVSEHVPLARSGASFRGLCPFHREKTPSFFVHPAKQIFHCFGCGEGGSVLHFLMKARNLSFAETVEELCDRYGIQVRYEAGGAPRKVQDDLFAILRVASDTFRELLGSPSGAGAREFLKRRGVTPEAAREFALGYGGGGNDLLKALARAGVDPARAEAAGLLASSAGGRRERFRGRVMFPIADARGRICGFGARALDDAQPKYLNSPESDAYRKSSVLYGLFQALPALRQDRRVVVVEGYMDLIALWQKGIRGVVATCGTALTESHARTLKRLADSVILFFDGDMAGKRSAVRAGGPLYAAGASPLVLFPPKGLDPDDWARVTEGSELSGKIAKAIPLMEYIERAAARKYDLSGIPGKMSYLRLTAKYLQWITDPAERMLYAQRVARAAGLPIETVLERLSGREADRGRGAAAPLAGPPRPAREEDLLIELLARDPSLARAMREDGVPELVEGEQSRESILFLLDRIDAGGSAEPGEALDEAVPDGVRRRVAEGILRAERPAEESRRVYADILLGLRIRKADRGVARIREEIRSAERGGDLSRAGELFAELKGAKREKERLELERRTRG